MTRDDYVYEEICSGKTKASVARSMDISRQRVQQLYSRAERDRGWQEDPMMSIVNDMDLNSHTTAVLVNTLHRYDIFTIEDAANISDYDIACMYRIGPYMSELVYNLRDEARKGVVNEREL